MLYCCRPTVRHKKMPSSYEKWESKDMVFSDDEEPLTPDTSNLPKHWDDVKDKTLRFGMYADKTMREMICRKRTRDYLRYILKWDELKPYSRAMIEVALQFYGELVEKPAPIKSRKRKVMK